jgi:hypothetical protein
MTRAEFTLFVERTLEQVIQLAEQHTGKTLPRKIGFQWLGRDETIWLGVVEAIVNRVYVDEEHIFPCVDIGVGDLSTEGNPVIVANVAGYPACAFQKNWTGREGPFVFIIGGPFLAKIEGKKVQSGEAFRFLIPDMKNLQK